MAKSSCDLNIPETLDSDKYGRANSTSVNKISESGTHKSITHTYLSSL